MCCLAALRALVCTTGTAGVYWECPPQTPDHMSKSDSEGVSELLVLVVFLGSGKEATLLPVCARRGLSGVIFQGGRM